MTLQDLGAVSRLTNRMQIPILLRSLKMRALLLAILSRKVVLLMKMEWLCSALLFPLLLIWLMFR